VKEKPMAITTTLLEALQASCEHDYACNVILDTFERMWLVCEEPSEEHATDGTPHWARGPIHMAPEGVTMSVRVEWTGTPVNRK
jgi:hypothetical protein